MCKEEKLDQPIALGYDDLDKVAGGDTYYTVKEGDTLKMIAKRYAIPEAVLCNWNAIGNPNKIFPGDKLVIRR